MCVESALFLSADPQKLKLVVRPKDTTVAAGSGVELYCIAEGHLPTIHWFKNGQEVNRALVGDGQVLEIEGVTAIDSGVYTCVASNRQTSLNASATVTVIGMYVISFTKTDITVYLGEFVSEIRCFSGTSFSGHSK